MALFDDFKDGRAFKNVKGDYAVLTRRNRESRAKKFGDITNFFDCEIVLQEGSFTSRQDRSKEELLKRKAQLLAKRGTSVRSNWRTLGKTWDEIASWKSSLTDKCTFDFLRGKAVLEASVSDGYSSN